MPLTSFNRGKRDLNRPRQGCSRFSDGFINILNAATSLNLYAAGKVA